MIASISATGNRGGRADWCLRPACPELPQPHRARPPAAVQPQPARQLYRPAGGTGACSLLVVHARCRSCRRCLPVV